MQTVYIKHEAEIEKAAKIIYDNLPFTPTMFQPHKPEWKENEVSAIQDQCRKIAYQVLIPYLDEIVQLKSSLSERTYGELRQKNKFPIKHGE